MDANGHEGDLRLAGDLQLSESQRQLVTRLADGLTVTEAAAKVGCSDRQARRQLRRVWDAVGARNRVQGMVELARIGLLEPVEPREPGLRERSR